MIMKKLFCSTMGLLALLGLSISNASAADTASLDPAGYIRDWVMLAPITLPEGASTGDLLLREQVKNEAALKPKEGDTIKINNKELVWKNVTTATSFFDFNAILKSVNDQSAGYMVTYLECDQDIPEVTMAVGSNDQARIYFNGVDIYAFTDARTLELDGDKGRVTLKKGVNVIVFKVLNQQNSWQGAMRLTDKSGAPLKGVKIKLAP
jgi:hypothetical protein